MHVLNALAELTLQDPEIVSRQTVWSFLAAGGPVMVPIGLCSVLVVALAMDRYLRARRGPFCPKGTDQVLDLLRVGAFDEARARADNLRAPAGRILLAGLRRQGLPVHDVERAMEDQGQKELERLFSPIRSIQVIANIAPLLGLLGTVLGISEAFGQVVQSSGMGKPEVLAGGIEKALVTTIAGLVVAIPSLLLAAHLGARVRRVVFFTDEKVAPAVEMIAGRGRTGDQSDAA
jgi:biopolymer transport protein ExbB